MSKPKSKPQAAKAAALEHLSANLRQLHNNSAKTAKSSRETLKANEEFLARLAFGPDPEFSFTPEQKLLALAVWTPESSLRQIYNRVRINIRQ